MRINSFGDQSFEEMQEGGFEYGDDGQAEKEMYAGLMSGQILMGLTDKQRKIAISLSEGKSRKQIANDLFVSEQAVHQIILRLRKRILKNESYDRLNYRRGVSKTARLPVPFMPTGDVSQTHSSYLV
jgi:DNA-binding CsgD family transcriptional regulator